VTSELESKGPEKCLGIAVVLNKEGRSFNLGNKAHSTNTRKKAGKKKKYGEQTTSRMFPQMGLPGRDIYTETEGIAQEVEHTKRGKKSSLDLEGRAYIREHT